MIRRQGKEKTIGPVFKFPEPESFFCVCERERERVREMKG